MKTKQFSWRLDPRIVESLGVFTNERITVTDLINIALKDFISDLNDQEADQRISDYFIGRTDELFDFTYKEIKSRNKKA